MSRHRLALGALALTLVLPVAACSGGDGHHAAPSDPSAHVAKRWWSNSAAPAGSTIDPKRPAAAAGQLQASKPEYCGMLRQTLAAGKSILPGASASDPALLASTEAFVAELQQVAPADIAGQWQLLGDALVAFVKSAGTSLGTDSAAVSKAAADISADASTNCHLDLSAVAAPAK